jgi:hypothetical protein
MLLLRRMGRERQARLPIEEASITMRMLYDEFACFCTPEFLQNSIEVVQQRLDERRAKGRTDVALLPLPSGAHNLHRLKRLFRYDIYRRYYADAPGTEGYLERLRPVLHANPRWFDDEVAKLAADLAQTPHYVYGSRDKRYAVEAIPPLAAETDDSGADGALPVVGPSARSAGRAPDETAPASTRQEKRG